MQTKNGLILLTCSILDVTCSYCGDSPCKIIVNMAVLVLCSPNGDKGAAIDLFHFVLKAEVTDDIGELAT